MPMPNAFVYPPSIYGSPSSKYGTNISAYSAVNNPSNPGFPTTQTGLQLGIFGFLFDGTECRLLKVAGAGTVNANDAVQIQNGNSNDYSVIQLPGTANTVFAAAVNDRVGGNLVSGDIAWMTIYGLAIANVAASTAANSFLVSSSTAGRLAIATAGTSLQSNIFLLNVTVAAGPYPIVMR